MRIAQEILTIKQVAEVLQVSADTVYRLAASGELQARKIGRIWRIPRQGVEHYMCKHVEERPAAAAERRELSSS